MAHGIMQDLIKMHKLPWHVESAGTNGFHTGEPPHSSSIKVAKQYGIDISKQVSQIFTSADFENFDIIYVMAKDVEKAVRAKSKNENQLKKVKLFLDELYPGCRKDVTDPWYGNEQGYLPVFKEIYKCCEAIVAKEILNEAKYTLKKS
jgi:protein-tyrosine phosphatase